MRATIYIRRIRDSGLETEVYLSRVDETFVREALTDLKRRYPPEEFRIDLTQVYWARKAEAEQAAA